MIGIMRCERVDDRGFQVPDETTLRAGITCMLYAIFPPPVDRVDIDRVLPFYVEHWLHRTQGDCDQALLLGALVDSGQCELADAFAAALPNIFSE